MTVALAWEATNARNSAICSLSCSISTYREQKQHAASRSEISWCFFSHQLFPLPSWLIPSKMNAILGRKARNRTDQQRKSKYKHEPAQQLAQQLVQCLPASSTFRGSVSTSNDQQCDACSSDALEMQRKTMKNCTILSGARNWDLIPLAPVGPNVPMSHHPAPLPTSPPCPASCIFSCTSTNRSWLSRSKQTIPACHKLRFLQSSTVDKKYLRHV